MTIKTFIDNVQNKHYDLHSGPNQGYYGGHMGYNYNPQPPPNFHPHQPAPIFKHYSFSKSTSHSGSGAAMSALTLLSFLFFLNILQQCLKDQMTSYINPTVAVMTAGKQEVEVDRSVTNEKEPQSTMLRIQPIQISPMDEGIGKAYSTKQDDSFEEPPIQRSLIKLKSKSDM